MREQVDQLFHGIPPWSRDGLGWRWNPDRTQIDGIADRVGCQSMTYDQILRVLDTFVLAIAEAFVQQASAEGQTDRIESRRGLGAG